jgi:hypothetical protein
VTGAAPKSTAARRKLDAGKLEEEAWARCAAGAERTARMLTVVMTLRSRGESVHAYLLEACRAARADRKAPPLVKDAA